MKKQLIKVIEELEERIKHLDNEYSKKVATSKLNELKFIMSNDQARAIKGIDMIFKDIVFIEKILDRH